MIVGFLRRGSTYRAPVRWYQGGPVSRIEYYVAAPGAKWYPDAQAFFPMNFFKGETNTGVGELTDQGPRDFRKYAQPVPCPGQDYFGSAEEFAGIVEYPGVTPPELLPDCDHPTHTAPPHPDRDPDWYDVVYEGMVLTTDGVERTYSGSGEIHWENPPGWFHGSGVEIGGNAYLADLDGGIGGGTGWGINLWLAPITSYKAPFVRIKLDGGRRDVAHLEEVVSIYLHGDTDFDYTIVTESVLVEPGSLTVTPHWD